MMETDKHKIIKRADLRELIISDLLALIPRYAILEKLRTDGYENHKTSDLCDSQIYKHLNELYSFVKMGSEEEKNLMRAGLYIEYMKLFRELKTVEQYAALNAILSNVTKLFLLNAPEEHNVTNKFVIDFGYGTETEDQGPEATED